MHTLHGPLLRHQPAEALSPLTDSSRSAPLNSVKNERCPGEKE
jgi:hypothetical protein